MHGAGLRSCLEELMFLKRAFYPGSRRQTNGSESWRRGAENVRTHSALQRGPGDGARTDFQSRSVACKSVCCWNKVMMTLLGRSQSRIGKVVDLMGHGCFAPNAFQSMM